MPDIVATNRWVYLDNNATTRADGRVVEAMLPFFLEHFANASSMHGLGSAAADAVCEARGQVRSLLGAERVSEIVFTSGGSESNNTAIFSAIAMQPGRDEIVTSQVEHPSVLAVCAYLETTGRARVHRIPVDRLGNLDLEAYRGAFNTRTALATIQWANNESGVIFPVETLAKIAHQAGALFHTDAVQAVGKLDLELQTTEIDMLSVSAHKMHGPKGVGALYVRHGVRLAPLVHGGRQERARRAGTENTPAIVGFGLAAELAQQALVNNIPRISALRDQLQREVLSSVPGSMVIGNKSNRLPNTVNIAFEEVEADSILSMLDDAAIAASSGSACSAGSMEPSHVLRAMKVPFSHLRGSVRFSLSRETSDRDVARVLEVLPQIVKDLQPRSIPMEAAYG
jgi:cysteine desulfurase